MRLSLKDDLELLLREFNVANENELLKKKLSSDEKLIRSMPLIEQPRRVEMTVDQCKKLCDKVGLRYHTGYEGRVIERVTTTESADRYGDIVRAKGIDNTNYRKNPVVLFAHNHGDFPVGKSIKEWIDKDVKGWRSWDLYFGDEIDTSGKSDLTFRMVDSGAMPGGSIGFIPGDAKADHTPAEREMVGLGRYGVEYLTCEKLEHSACSVPANPEALSNCLKSIEVKRLKATFALSDVDRMVAEKMLDEELADIFASILGVQRTIIVPKAAPCGTNDDDDDEDEKEKKKKKEEEKEIVLRPYPSEHAARIRDPGDFIPDSFRRKNITDGIDIIIGKLKDVETDSMVTQAYRFDAETFTPAEAKQWLKDHDIAPMSFEPAEKKSIVNNIVVNVDMKSAEEKLIQLNDHIKATQETFESFVKAYEARVSELMAATQRALTALESRSKSTSLYDRKEIEGVLRLPK